MACISKLASAIAYDCDTGATGLVSAIIINKADIASFTVDTRTASVSGVTLVSELPHIKSTPLSVHSFYLPR